MKWLEKIVEIKIRLENGMGWLYWPKNFLVLLAALKYITTDLIILSLKTQIVLVILGIIGLYFLGWLDLNVIKIYQIQQNLQTGKYNPYFIKKLGK